MRIGILTQALNGNYGGVLQNYALQQVLKQMGHNPVTIDRHISRPESTIKKFAKIIIRNKNIYFDSSLLTKAEKRTLYARQIEFIARYIDRIGPVISQTDFDRIVGDASFDAFIVGSDQCWRPCYSANIANYFLDFTVNRNVKRVVYAASFGVDKWEFSEAQTNDVIKAAKALDAVSVREESGKDLCAKYLGIKAEWVLDPTMLLGVEHFRMFIDTSETQTPFITEYLLEDSPERKTLIEKVKHLSGINQCKDNNSSKLFKRFTPISQYNNIAVEEWISNIANAKLVVTDSFHGVVFSILFNTPFIVRLNKIRGNARIESLLKDFGLEKCICSNVESLNIPIIDWTEVNEHLEKRRTQSFNFLTNSLS